MTAENNNWRVGDIVELNSGGPAMAVDRVTDDGRVRCVWRHSDGLKQLAYFPAVCVKQRAA
jgi:uncharacterized protein YodC (DUF2158 family)